MDDWVRKYFGAWLTEDKLGHYYFTNLYDLFYQNRKTMNNGDWFGEFVIAINIVLTELGVTQFYTNSGRVYVLTDPPGEQYRGDQFPWTPREEE